MKRLILIPLILILTACASVQTPPTNADPISVIGVEPGVMKTIAPPSPTSAAPKTEPSATATKDPMKDAPTGTTGVDENGMFYMDAEDGNRYYYDTAREHFNWENSVDGYTYFYFPATVEQEAYLARPLIEKYYVYDTPDWNAIPMDVWVKYGTPGSESIIKMSHRDSTDIDDRSSTADHMNDFMMSRFSVDGVQLWSSLQEKNGLPFDFKFVGKTMSSSFGIDGGFTATFVSEAELKPLFEANKAVRSSGNEGFVYLVYDGVQDGRILVRVASSMSMERLLIKIGGDPEYQLRKMLFLPIFNIITSAAEEDLINVASSRDAGIAASDSASIRSKDGLPDLQIIIANP